MNTIEKLRKYRKNSFNKMIWAKDEDLAGKYRWIVFALDDLLEELTNKRILPKNSKTAF